MSPFNFPLNYYYYFSSGPNGRWSCVPIKERKICVSIWIERKQKVESCWRTIAPIITNITNRSVCALVLYNVTIFFCWFSLAGLIFLFSHHKTGPDIHVHNYLVSYVLIYFSFIFYIKWFVANCALLKRKEDEKKTVMILWNAMERRFKCGSAEQLRTLIIIKLIDGFYWKMASTSIRRLYFVFVAVKILVIWAQSRIYLNEVWGTLSLEANGVFRGIGSRNKRTLRAEYNIQRILWYGNDWLIFPRVTNWYCTAETWKQHVNGARNRCDELRYKGFRFHFSISLLFVFANFISGLFLTVCWTPICMLMLMIYNHWKCYCFRKKWTDFWHSFIT